MIFTKIRNILLFASVLLMPGAGQDVANVGVSEVVTHTVRPGESVSLICIDYYGRFRGCMGDVIRKLNPGVEDLSELTPGVVLRLPRPRQSSSVNSDPTRLFGRNVSAVQGVVTHVAGKAFLLPDSQGAKTPLHSNTIVYPGDVVETADRGRVELVINREIVVRIDENSRIRIKRFRNKKPHHETSLIGLSAGRAWVKVKEFTDGAGRFRLELPAAVAEVHGTVYGAAVRRAGMTDLRVYRGTVAVRSAQNHQTPLAFDAKGGERSVAAGPKENWTRIVHSNQRVLIGRDGRAPEVVSVSGKEQAEWTAWNENRDARISQLFLENAR